METLASAILGLQSGRVAHSPPSRVGPPGPEPWANFDQGLPDPALFPVALLRQCLLEVLDTDGQDALRYFGEGGGHEMQWGAIGLRRALAAWMGRRDGRPHDVGGVTLVHGSTDGLALAVRAFVEPGDGAVVEAATYPHTKRFLQAAGAVVRTVPLDDEGMVVEKLPDVLEGMVADGLRPKVVYTIPTFHAPTGTVLPRHRRERLLEIAEQQGVIVLEDNCYYAFHYDAPPPPTLLALDTSGLVLQSDSFSKYVAPGLRLAWLAGSPPAVEAAVRVRQDFAVSQLVARAMERYVDAGMLDRHLDDLRGRYRHKRDLTAAALREHCLPWVRFQVPTGGFYFWLELAPGVDWGAVRERLAVEGVAVRPGDGMVADDDPRRFVRISSVQVPEDDIAAGIAALGRALAGAAGIR